MAIKSEKTMLIYKVYDDCVKVKMKKLTPEQQMKKGIKKLEDFIKLSNKKPVKNRKVKNGNTST